MVFFRSQNYFFRLAEQHFFRNIIFFLQFFLYRASSAFRDRKIVSIKLLNFFSKKKHSPRPHPLQVKWMFPYTKIY